MVTAELLLQGIEQRMFSDTDRIEVVIDWRPPDRRVRDIDNPIKPLLDALEASSLVYKNDNQIDSLQITRPTLGRPVKVLDIFIG
jgi:Holliday junction resolvase RusA-like endonuclease